MTPLLAAPIAVLVLSPPVAYLAAALADLRLNRRDRRDAHRLQDDRETDEWLAAIRRIR